MPFKTQSPSEIKTITTSENTENRSTTDKKKAESGQIVLTFEDEHGCGIDGIVSCNGKFCGETTKHNLSVPGELFLSAENVEIVLRTELKKYECKSRIPEEIPDDWKLEFVWELNASEYGQVDIIQLEFDIQTIQLGKPSSLYELTNYVRASDVEWFLRKFQNKLVNETYDDLVTLRDLLDSHVRYVYDPDGYWKLPNQTIKTMGGDCEDYSVALLSLFKAYDPNLKCYNLLLPEHVTTFCKIENPYYPEFAFFDQGETRIRTNFYQAYTKEIKIARIKKLVNDYFSYYGLERQPHNFYAAFDDRTYYVFNSDEEFYEWCIHL